jgi:pimeloyl-ACP methyl ester carboxylesterase
MADVPVLVLRGEHSDIMSRETLLAMADRHPHLEQLTVAGQGHPPQLWRRDLIDRISQFIAARAEAEAR